MPKTVGKVKKTVTGKCYKKGREYRIKQLFLFTQLSGLTHYAAKTN
jgi:hypothetical protein